MIFNRNKIFFYLIIIFTFLFNQTKENHVNEYIYINLYFILIQEISKNINKQIRQLWEETVEFDSDGMDNESEEGKSINDHCKKSNYKYFVNFLEGHNYYFDPKKIEIYKNFAVSQVYI